MLAGSFASITLNIKDKSTFFVFFFPAERPSVTEYDYAVASPVSLLPHDMQAKQFDSVCIFILICIKHQHQARK